VNAPVRVVLLGGGYVSIWACRALHRRLRPQLRRGAVEVTADCPENVHVYHGWTGEVLGGVVSPGHGCSRASPHQFGHRRHHLHAGKATAGDDHGEQAPALRRIRGGLGLLQDADRVRPQRQQVRRSLQPPAVLAQPRHALGVIAGAGADEQMIVRQVDAAGVARQPDRHRTAASSPAGPAG